MGARENLLAQIAEAKLRLSDVTRELDESSAAEQDPMFGEKLHRARECVLELERTLLKLSL